MWFHFTRFQNPTYELRASLGTGSRISRPAVIAQPSTNPAEGSLSTGIDGQGNALITWGQFSSHGDKGLFTAIHANR